ncbi:MAG: hypothetical protein HFI10_11050 [Lachnospiraceae bacterium]|jgi:mannosyltransferase OCH1-like enzyme|nr:hypothetical protein [Lachnospiraceae bacterium]
MYTPKEFEKAVKESNGLVCYGTGKRFLRFIEHYSESDILQRLLYCVDKNKDLHGKNLEIKGRSIPIRSFQAFQDIREQNIVLLITNLYYDQVLDDLKEKGYLDGIQYYCFTHLYGMLLEENAMKKSIPSDIRITSEPVIPKKIHYCWFGEAPVPDKYRKWMESWEKFCPDYEIIRWDESNYDIKKNTYMYEAYQCKKWGFVPDYARLDIIYEHGGIYLDTDVELVANLDDMLYQEAYVGFEREENINLGLGFGAKKGMPVIAEMREFYKKRHFIDKSGNADLTASPVYQTGFLLEKGLILNGEYQRIGDLVVYPEKMLSGKCPYTRRVQLTSYTKSIHHYEATWADDTWKMRNELFEREMNS